MSSRLHQRRSGSSGRKLAAQIAQQMAAVIPNMVAQLHQQLAHVLIPAPAPAPAAQEVANTKFNYKYFNSCGPPKFDGSEGAIGLLQWFEGIENTFLNNDCPENLKVRHGTSVLKKKGTHMAER